jgi:hypothetical protein
MKSRWWFLLAVPLVCAGCLNSKALGQLMLPRMTFQSPIAWDCTQRVPHPQGQTNLSGLPVMCDRCANRSEVTQPATINDQPYLVPPAAAFYRCENGQVLADAPVMTYAPTPRR